MAEADPLKGFQCRFDPDRGYRPRVAGEEFTVRWPAPRRLPNVTASQPSLQELTPELYAKLRPIERRAADRQFRAWSARAQRTGVRSSGPLFAAMRAYGQGNLSLLVASAFPLYAAVIALVLDAASPVVLVPALLVLAAEAALVVALGRRSVTIGRYFRARGVTPRTRTL